MVYFLLSILALGCIYVAFQLWKERQIIVAASCVDQKDLDLIATGLEKVGNTLSRSFFILSKETPKGHDFPITLPDRLDVVWAQGKTVMLTVDEDSVDEDNCGSVSEPANKPIVNVQLAPIPRISMANDKEANRYQPEYWFKKNPDLEAISTRLFPKAPEKVLAAVVNRIGRVNAPFSWVQEPPKTKCKHCRKKLTPIFEYWGGDAGLSMDATYYVAGCNCTSDVYYVFVQNS